MTHVDDLCSYLDQLAPPELAESWDNVGLLVGDRQQEVRRVMTCLTLTPESVAEALERKADLVVSHHPLPFRPIKSITTDTVTGRLLLQLITGQVAVHSPHTSFDSASNGINQQWAEMLQLREIKPVRPFQNSSEVSEEASGDSLSSAALGSGRWGRLAQPMRLQEFTERVKLSLGLSGLKLRGEDDQQIATVAVACGSAGEFLAPAVELGCDALVTGETSFHTCLEAKALGVALILPGHYASERFAVESFADRIAEQFPGLEVWPSLRECDPLRWA